MRRTLHCLFAFCVLFVAGGVHAQTRTWVSGVGDDVNPCSRTAPCKTFAGAISKTAAGGVINALDGGGFGAVTITKSITLEAEGQVAGILSAGTNAIIINAAATDRIVLRNLRINGAGTGLDGVRILQAGEVVIEDTTIENMTQNALEVLPTTGAVQLVLRNCVIRGVASGAAQPDAILLAPTGTGKVIATIDNTQIRTVRGGLTLIGNTEAVLRDSILAGGLDNGITLLNAAGVVGDVLLDNVTIQDFGAAGVSASGDQARIRISDSTISGNATGVMTASSGQVLSFGNNRLISNAVNGSVTPTSMQ